MALTVLESLIIGDIVDAYPFIAATNTSWLN